MTHTLHRRGSAESLADDFVVFAIAAQGFNAEGAAKKFEKFFDIVKKYNPNNFGDMRTGNSLVAGEDVIRKSFKDNSIVHAVFNDEDTVTKVLKELKEADLGLSIVVSGLVHKTDECCKKVGLEMHTVEKSLGIIGNTPRLPDESILEVTTMCGHGMIAFNLVKKLADDVKKGRTSPNKAAKEIAKQCVCGVVNIPRVERLIKAMAS
ncbi:hypothetical protein [Acetomicrobium sp. S15 = DSM 107314]|jgi:hypothetical protein|uniref:hypothetical protein n=1 Tax=Acetomicrobium sp. S15 = DSM 107314 TaxID=2529858 RepID=UPI0018E1584A|nr:hypothetical protein [Acetomicrobium sp. S15 = DSM 107314]